MRCVPFHEFCFATGSRPSEARRATYEMIDFRRSEVDFPKYVCKGGKRGKSVSISNNWWEFLKKYQGRKGFISPIPETKEIRYGCRRERKRIYDNWRRNCYHKDLKRSGMFDERIQDGSRHLFGCMTYWYERQMGRREEGALIYTQEQLGHYGSKANTAIDHYIDFEDPRPLKEQAIGYFSYFPDDEATIGSIKDSGLEKSGTD